MCIVVFLCRIQLLTHTQKDLSRLVAYAKKFGMRDEVMKYVEVMV